MQYGHISLRRIKENGHIFLRPIKENGHMFLRPIKENGHMFLRRIKENVPYTDERKRVLRPDKRKRTYIP